VSPRHGDPLDVSRAQVLAALRRRRGRRRETLDEIAAALAALTAAVERHVAMVEEARWALAARGGDTARLDAYEGTAERLRAELRAAEQRLGAAYRAAGGNPPAPA